MSFLESWVNTPLASAVGWALFHSLWQGGLIAAALIILLRFIRSSNIRCRTACIALAAIVSSFAATLIYFLPASGRSFAVTNAPVLPVWRVGAELGAGGDAVPLALAIPWLAPLWLIGVALFTCATQRDGSRQIVYAAAAYAALPNLGRTGSLS